MKGLTQPWKPVIVDVKLQNLKANHNGIKLLIMSPIPVIVDVKLQNLKANHNKMYVLTKSILL